MVLLQRILYFSRSRGGSTFSGGGGGGGGGGHPNFPGGSKC